MKILLLTVLAINLVFTQEDDQPPYDGVYDDVPHDSETNKFDDEIDPDEL